MNISNFHASGSKISLTNNFITQIQNFETRFFDSLNAWLITWNADYLAYVVGNKTKGQISRRR